MDFTLVGRFKLPRQKTRLDDRFKLTFLWKVGRSFEDWNCSLPVAARCDVARDTGGEMVL